MSCSARRARFYDFWLSFQSWREFRHLDQHNVDEAEARAAAERRSARHAAAARTAEPRGAPLDGASEREGAGGQEEGGGITHSQVSERLPRLRCTTAQAAASRARRCVQDGRSCHGQGPAHQEAQRGGEGARPAQRAERGPRAETVRASVRPRRLRRRRPRTRSASRRRRVRARHANQANSHASRHRCELRGGGCLPAVSREEEDRARRRGGEGAAAQGGRGGQAEANSPATARHARSGCAERCRCAGWPQSARQRRSSASKSGTPCAPWAASRRKTLTRCSRRWTLCGCVCARAGYRLKAGAFF